MLNIYGILKYDKKYSLIESLEVGDKVVGWGNVCNTILSKEQIDLGSCENDNIKSELDGNKLTIYKLNDIQLYLTSFQPVMTCDGWKSLNPTTTLYFQPQFGYIGKLQIGDVLFIADIDSEGKMLYDCIELKEITKRKLDISKHPIHLINVLGNYSYHVNGLVLHCLTSCYNEQTKILNNINDLNEDEMRKFKAFFTSNFKELQNILGIPTINLIAKHIGIKVSD